MNYDDYLYNKYDMQQELKDQEYEATHDMSDGISFDEYCLNNQDCQTIADEDGISITSFDYEGKEMGHIHLDKNVAVQLAQQIIKRYK